MEEEIDISYDWLEEWPEDYDDDYRGEEEDDE